MALTRNGAPFVWTDSQQAAFETLKACVISAPILGFPTEDGRFLLDTDASLFACRGIGRWSSCQPEPSSFSATVLYDASGDAGGSGDV